MTSSSTKQVQIIARISFKSDTRKVVYFVRSSAKNETVYRTSFFNGLATGCTCPATVVCYHMLQLEVIEQARIVYAEALVLLSKLFTAPLIIEQSPEKDAAAQAAFAAADCIKPRFIQKEEDMNIPLMTDIDPSTLTPEDAQSLAELDALVELALSEPLQDDEIPTHPYMTLSEAREAIRNDAFACVPACHRDTLRAEAQARMEQAPLTRNAGFNCLLNVS